MSESMDWASLRARIAKHGMRNSNCVAIAPTATISNIIGVSASIEPNYQNLYVKSNLSGEFTVVNEHLVRDLKKLGLWDTVMVSDLKHFDGSIGKIDRVPQELRSLYATAFEVEPRWIVEAAARRQKWIDQAQSLNIYMAGRLRQEARRHLQARLAARAQDHLLPAHARRDLRREVHGQGRRAERRVGRADGLGAARWPRGSAPRRARESPRRWTKPRPSSARSTTPPAKRASKSTDAAG